MDVVNAILEKNVNSNKSISVHKDLELEIDEGTLLASDYNVFDKENLRSSQDTYLKNLTRDNVQVLINKIWMLQTERVDEAIVGILPKPVFVLPRARSVPKPKPLTKWQQFAKEKGITSKKKNKSKVTWDEELEKWIPKYGYKKAKADEQKEWLVEVNDPTKFTNGEDPFTASKTAKREKQAKNELQRLRNLAKAKNVKLPRVGIPSTEHFRDARQLAAATTIARASTASVGKFQSRLPKEKDAKDIASHVPGIKKKRKEAPLSVVQEKQRNKKLAESILRSKSTILHVDAPVPSTKSAKSSNSGGKKKSSKKEGKGAKKPKGGKGKRDLRSKVGGRKRR
ncbi:ribosome biogenesis regulatory protein homolog [Cephus cinctus]|uniref:Ribosome biogenesis regulatory protein n=1 Tax=Cephus cinctus TaxID=211228 RepID=A0AAJ7BLM0_CEPCN|nr:ribosome biogenesis regulatory protein homolog [Cephus cinctus]